MIAVLYDVHGNLPALEAVIADAGADAFFLGGDLAAFGAWPVETVRRLAELPVVGSIRGNTERWLEDAHDLDAGAPMQAAIAQARALLGPARVAELVALETGAELPGGVAFHGSPVSDVRSFAATAADDDAELLGGVSAARVVFGHTHVQFRRRAGAVELVNPGSVGVPLDGDRRAAYATLQDDGTLELRRVAYDWEAAREAVLERAAGAAWGEVIAGRLDRAGV